MSALAWSRRHRLFALVAACATALRAVVLLAYQPALIFPDSERYLEYAWRFVNGHWSPDWLRTSADVRYRTVDGTLVFADISGFTRLTERLAAKGRYGAEEMSEHLDQVLSALLDAAAAYDGWLVKWGGDALLLMFDGTNDAARACAAAGALVLRAK